MLAQYHKIKKKSVDQLHKTNLHIKLLYSEI